MLLGAQKTGRSLNPSELEKEAQQSLNSIPNLETEYCALVQASDLEPVLNWTQEKTVMLVAAYVGGVRLIDNVIIE